MIGCATDLLVPHREHDAPPARRIVRDIEYSWSNSTMMNLYSGTTDPLSHRCRIVLFEKGMDFEVTDIDLFNKPEDLAVINPRNNVPVLLDRDLVLYDPNIINEYIDERFPHPQLMPPDPIMRARARQLLHGTNHGRHWIARFRLGRTALRKLNIGAALLI